MPYLEVTMALALIPTTTPILVGSELANIHDALASKNLSRQGKYTSLCEQ